MGVGLREARPADTEVVAEILLSTGAFTAAEIDIALELFTDALLGSPDYEVLVAEREARVCGYACFGAAPFTVGTWDLYWIAVAPTEQGGGVGTTLMRGVESLLRERGARILLVDTASKPSYDVTNAFYRRLGYAEVARIADYYEPGDDRITYRLDL